MSLDQQRSEQIAAVLTESLPYITRFIVKTIVVKYGGNAMVDDELKHNFARDIVLMKLVGMNPIVVHGGGPQIGEMLERLNIESKFIDGMRVTDTDTMDVVEMVLTGRVNKQIVSGINNHGRLAVGLCGIDGGLIEARTLGGGSHGLVGEVAKVNTKILSPLLEEGYVPVISSVANSSDGRSHNINADTVAGELAAALGAEKLILLTDTPGILRNENDPSSLIEKIRLSEARELIDKGIVKAGMKPKVECCIRSLAQGVNAAHIIDGRTPHSLLLEVFTDAGIGTMVMGRG